MEYRENTAERQASLCVQHDEETAHVLWLLENLDRFQGPPAPPPAPLPSLIPFFIAEAKRMKAEEAARKAAPKAVKNRALSKPLQKASTPVQQGASAIAAGSLCSSSPSTRFPTPSTTSPELQRITSIVHTAADHDGLAITVQFSDKRHPTAIKSDDPTETINSNLRREIARLGLTGLAYFIAWDANAAGRLHLHGVMIPGDHDPALIREAFVKACGRWTGKSAPRQWKAEPITDAAGWAGYTLKTRNARAQARTRKLLNGSRLTTTSQALTRLAKGPVAERSKPTPAPVPEHVPAPVQAPVPACRKATRGPCLSRQPKTTRRPVPAVLGPLLHRCGTFQRFVPTDRRTVAALIRAGPTGLVVILER